VPFFLCAKMQNFAKFCQFLVTFREISFVQNLCFSKIILNFLLSQHFSQKSSSFIRFCEI
jgi:hypothetical protein